jgi:hypothetical protein
VAGEVRHNFMGTIWRGQNLHVDAQWNFILFSTDGQCREATATPIVCGTS